LAVEDDFVETEVVVGFGASGDVVGFGASVDVVDSGAGVLGGEVGTGSCINAGVVFTGKAVVSAGGWWTAVEHDETGVSPLGESTTGVGFDTTAVAATDGRVP